MQINRIFDFIGPRGFIPNGMNYNFTSDLWDNNFYIDKALNLLNKNLDGYTEEVIRHDSVLRGTVRIASVDIEYNGVTFPKGTFVYLNAVSANFDNDCFIDPISIIKDRKDINKSLSFGERLVAFAIVDPVVFLTSSEIKGRPAFEITSSIRSANN